MKALSLQKAIIQRGGTAEIVTETHKNSEGNEWTSHTLKGILAGHDIEMSLNNGHTYTGESSFYTVRPIAKRGHWDMGSDYNPGGYEFNNKINQLDWLLR